MATNNINYETYIQSRDDDNAYLEFKKKYGPLELHPLFNREIEDPNPVFNTDCKTNKCIYDIREIVDEFIIANNDDPNLNENLMFFCQVCSTKVNFVQFQASKTLQDNLLDILDQYDVEIEKQDNKDIQLLVGKFPSFTEFDERGYDHIITEYKNNLTTNFHCDAIGKSQLIPKLDQFQYEKDSLDEFLDGGFLGDDIMEAVQLYYRLRFSKKHNYVLLPVFSFCYSEETKDFEGDQFTEEFQYSRLISILSKIQEIIIIVRYHNSWKMIWFSLKDHHVYDLRLLVSRLEYMTDDEIGFMDESFFNDFIEKFLRDKFPEIKELYSVDYKLVEKPKKLIDIMKRIPEEITKNIMTYEQYMRLGLDILGEDAYKKRRLTSPKSREADIYHKALGWFIRAFLFAKSQPDSDPEKLRKLSQANCKKGICIYLSNGIISVARKSFDDAVSQDPNNHEAHVWIGDIIPDFAETKFQNYNKGLNLQKPWQAHACVGLGNYYLNTKKKNIDKSIEFFDEAINQDQTYARAHNDKGIAQLAKKKANPQALTCFETAKSVDGKFSDAYLNIARFHINKSDWLTALRICEVGIDHHNHWEFYLMLGEIHEKRSKGKERSLAFNILDAGIQKFSHHGELDKYKGDLLVLSKQKEEAALCYLSAAKKFREFNGNLQESDLCLKQATKLAPKNDQIFVEQANIANSEGKTKEALDGLMKVFNINAMSDEGYFTRGIIYDKSNEKELALQGYSMAIELNPKMVKAYNKKGICLRSSNKLHEAIDIYDLAIQKGIADEETHLLKSRALFQLKEMDEIFPSLEESLKINPRYHESLFARANVAKHFDSTNIAEFYQDYLDGMVYLYCRTDGNMDVDHKSSDRYIKYIEDNCGLWFEELDYLMKRYQNEKKISVDLEYSTSNGIEVLQVLYRRYICFQNAYDEEGVENQGDFLEEQFMINKNEVDDFRGKIIWLLLKLAEIDAEDEKIHNQLSSKMNKRLSSLNKEFPETDSDKRKTRLTVRHQFLAGVWEDEDDGIERDLESQKTIDRSLSIRKSQILQESTGKSKKVPNITQNAIMNVLKRSQALQAALNRPQTAKESEKPDESPLSLSAKKENESHQTIKSKRESRESEPISQGELNNIIEEQNNENEEIIELDKEELQSMMQNIRNDLLDKYQANDVETPQTEVDPEEEEEDDYNDNYIFEQKYKLSKGDIQNFQNFYSLQWYYYYYDVEKYKILWKEYENKMSQIILKSVGFEPDLQDKTRVDQITGLPTQRGNMLPSDTRPMSKNIIMSTNAHQGGTFSLMSPHKSPEESIKLGKKLNTHPVGQSNQISNFGKKGMSKINSNNYSRINSEVSLENNLESSRQQSIVLSDTKFGGNIEIPVMLRHALSDEDNNPMVPNRSPTGKGIIRNQGAFSSGNKSEKIQKKTVTHTNRSSNRSQALNHNDEIIDFSKENQASLAIPRQKTEKSIMKDNVQNLPQIQPISYKASSKLKELHKKNVQAYPEQFRSESYRTTPGYHGSHQAEKKIDSKLVGGIAQPYIKPNLGAPTRLPILDNSDTQVTFKDIDQLRRLKYVNENTLNFWALYLKSKQLQIPPMALQKQKARAFFFTTDFIRLYVSDQNKEYPAYHYERVKYLTKDFSGQGYTILHLFDKLFFPVFEIGPGGGGPINPDLNFKLIMAEPLKRELSIYDPLAMPSNITKLYPDLKKNKLVRHICHYLRMELNDRGGVDIDVQNEWNLKVQDATPTENRDFSGVYVCNYMYMILKGMVNPFFTNHELDLFTSKLVDALSKRAV